MQQQWHGGFKLPTSERRSIVGLPNSNFLLCDDRSGIDAGVHEMDRHSSVSKAGLERCSSGPKTGKHREQTKMQVEYSTMKLIDNAL